MYVRRSGIASAGVSSSAATQLMAAALLLPFLPWTAHGASLDPAVAGSVLGLALLSTAVAYIIYFHLIDTVGPTQAATVTFVSPMAGILGGAALLGEPVGPGLIAGLALIFLGIPLSARELPTFWPFRRRGTS